MSQWYIINFQQIVFFSIPKPYHVYFTYFVKPYFKHYHCRLHNYKTSTGYTLILHLHCAYIKYQDIQSNTMITNNYDWKLIVYIVKRAGERLANRFVPYCTSCLVKVQMIKDHNVFLKWFNEQDILGDL